MHMTQVGEEGEGTAASAVASRTTAESRGRASRSGATARRIARDGKYLERATGARWSRGAACAAARATGRARCGAAPRADEDARTWRTSGRVPDRAVAAVAGRYLDRAALRATVQREPGVADPHRARFFLPTSVLESARARRGGDPALETRALAGAKKTPRNKAAPSSSSTSRD